MKARQPADILRNKQAEFRLLINKAEILERLADLKFGETITLLTEAEKQRGRAISNLFSCNYFSECASKNKDIDAQVYQTLTGVLQGKFAFESRMQQIDYGTENLDPLNVLTHRLEQLKMQDREAIKSPFIKWAVGTGLVALIIGIPALVLYFFNPTEWVYPYGWMAIYEIAGAIIAPLLLLLSAYIFKICVDHKESVLKIHWEGVSNNGIKTIVDSLTSEDVALLQKINSPEWKAQFDAAQKKYDSPAETENLNPQFGSPLDTTPTSPTGNQSLVETQDTSRIPKIND